MGFSTSLIIIGNIMSMFTSTGATIELCINSCALALLTFMYIKVEEELYNAKKI